MALSWNELAVEHRNMSAQHRDMTLQLAGDQMALRQMAQDQETMRQHNCASAGRLLRRALSVAYVGVETRPFTTIDPKFTLKDFDSCSEIKEGLKIVNASYKYETDSPVGDRYNEFDTLPSGLSPPESLSQCTVLYRSKSEGKSGIDVTIDCEQKSLITQFWNYFRSHPKRLKIQSNE